MSENEKNKSAEEKKNQPTEAAKPDYRYRWSYGEQLAYDTAQNKKSKRSGVAIYAIVMTAVFLLCFAMLAGTLIWYGAGEKAPLDQEEESEKKEEEQAGGAMSTQEVSELVTPSTVLIYAAGTSSYSYGTGFFIGSDGYIATNYHVVEGASSCTVTLYSGKEYTARVVGYRKDEDLAVLKIKGKNHPVLKIGDSDSLKVGERAIAVGNPAGDEGAWSTTQGIFSALNRKVTVEESNYVLDLRMIQTDAALNPGNSGGPLCNDRGEVVGIVTRKLTENEGISYAIPINEAMLILNALVEDGNADDVEVSFCRVRPTIGISGTTIQAGKKYTYKNREYEAEVSGFLIMSVDSSGFAKGRLFANDIITKIGDQKISGLDELTEALYDYRLGDTLRITVFRNGSSVTVRVPLED